MKRRHYSAGTGGSASETLHSLESSYKCIACFGAPGWRPVSCVGKSVVFLPRGVPHGSTFRPHCFRAGAEIRSVHDAAPSPLRMSSDKATLDRLRIDRSSSSGRRGPAVWLMAGLVVIVLLGGGALVWWLQRPGADVRERAASGERKSDVAPVASGRRQSKTL